ncbi:NADP-dependent oxidoreductase [Roseiterribacter gracilis]|uniref:NADP-dependent oxidoreductase n=1 Tax=Roseiterribacter gracilis TaxID=2812848 RepID=A0A8S8X766_9PROT|nr:NADP-dependent oxidoreductase [Rhodospirillales bacterium TMPK1]
MKQNQEVVLLRQPETRPIAADFELRNADMPSLGDGEMLVETLYLSLDPYMGTAIKGKHLSGGVGAGDVMPGETIARVVESLHPDFTTGDLVLTRSGWRRYARATTADKLPSLPDGVPASAYLGVLGMPGLTAWAGTVRLAQPLPGQTFVVSAASGAVGSAAGQIAKNMGARVVGIAGSAEKCAYVRDRFGFDACVDYKQANWRDALAAACPDGIDAYFDNVGGTILEGVLLRLALGARIVLCGMMQQYVSATPLPGPALGPIIGKRATMKGLVVYDHADLLPTWRRVGAEWIQTGRLYFKEERVTGLDAAPAALERLMAGGNFGKLVVEVAPG